MKIHTLQLTVLCVCLLSLRAVATTYYVDINGPNPTPPYTSWSTAATNIQDAISETVNGDLVLVNPGVYQSDGYTAPDGTLTAVDVTNAITIQSVNGEAETSINGSNVMRCIYLANGATLTGFTLENGSAENGGGIYCASTAGSVISNCVISANAASNQGGGAYQGTFFNCTILGNRAQSEGGGLANAVIFRSLIVSNKIFGLASGFGGGAYNSSIFSSAIADNLAISEGGGAYGGTLVNCTVTGNTASQAGGGTASCSETNCIIYYNQIYSSESNEMNSFSDELYYCCTAPNPGGDYAVFTNDPALADISHISLNSPCRGAGEPTTANTADIDGNPWNTPPSIGCSEIPSGGDYGNLIVGIATPFTNWAVGYPLNFQTANSGPDYNTVWNFGDGTIVTNMPYISHTWSAVGTYPVTLTAYNDSYPEGISVTQMVSITVPSVYYVNLNSPAPVPPYMSWATAAANIQDAVNVATPGSLVLVTNGPTIPGPQNNFISTNAAFYLNGGATAPDGSFYRVVITNAITVESVNGPVTTYIGSTAPEGAQANCVYLADGATLSGFTITNFLQSGQITATSTNAVITNCVMTHYVGVNSGMLDDCSLVLYSGPQNSTLNNCSLVGFCDSVNSTLNGCIISNNCQVLGGVLNNCILVNNTNSTTQWGAATAMAGYPLVLNNCLISNNVTLSDNGGGYGGGVYNTFESTSNYYTNCILNNCTLAQNSAQYEGGAAYGAELNNCLISSNSARTGGGVGDCLLNNCILIGNSNTAAVNAVLTNCTLIGNVNSGAIDCTLDQCTLTANVDSGAVSSALNNCLIVSNVATGSGEGGGAWECSLTNCVLADNVATNGGGAYQSILVNCTVSANTSLRGGGGVYDSTLYQCSVIGNFGGGSGGAAVSSTLNNCLIISNVATLAGEGGGAYGGSLTNCILADNVATNGGGAYQSTLVNCTVSANTALLTGGGIYDSAAQNCILYYNTNGDVYPNSAQYPLRYCCTPVLPPALPPPANDSVHNITNAPLFVNLAGGDFHLQSSSPCINSGNNAYISTVTDLDGNPRIAGGIVDIGAYEYQNPVSSIPYVWLEQYGLPINTNTDTSSPNGTAFNVYQDWIAGLNPTNPASVLAMQSPAATNNASGIKVTWQSVSGILYLLQRSTNLASQPPFSTIQSNITGQTNTTSYTDSSATNNVPYFYRVGVTAP